MDRYQQVHYIKYGKLNFIEYAPHSVCLLGEQSVRKSNPALIQELLEPTGKPEDGTMIDQIGQVDE